MHSDTPNAGSARGFRSLTTRLIVWTLLAVGGIYAATVVVSNGLQRRMALAAAEREAVNETDAAVSHVEDALHAVEERTLVLANVVETLEPGAEDLDRLLRVFVPRHPEVYWYTEPIRTGEPGWSEPYLAPR